jgi:hypothetical protein
MWIDGRVMSWKWIEIGQADVLHAAFVAHAGDPGVDEDDVAQHCAFPMRVERLGRIGAEDRAAAGPAPVQPRRIALVRGKIGG